jgi:hypothetical protein
VTTLQFDDSAITWRKIDDDIVAVDLKRSEYLTVNPLGKVLWMSLAAGTSEHELIELLVSHTGFDYGHATTEVSSFLQQLRERRLLRES